MNCLHARYLYFIYHANTCSKGFVRRRNGNDFLNDISICLLYAEAWFVAFVKDIYLL